MTNWDLKSWALSCLERLSWLAHFGFRALSVPSAAGENPARWGVVVVPRPQPIKVREANTKGHLLLPHTLPHRCGRSRENAPRCRSEGKKRPEKHQHQSVPVHGKECSSRLRCPQDATGGSSPKRQSNLASKLQRGASGDSEFTSDAPIPCPSLCSCSEQLGLKGNPPSHLSSRSHYVSHDCGTLSKNRMGSEDQYGSKPSHVCASRRICGHLGDCRGCFSPAELPVTSAPGSGSCQCPPTSPSKSDDSFHRGPGLTLHHLNSSTLVESTGSSAALQTLLKSSRTSADLHRSIRQLKREAASSMGALSSSPWESKRPLFPCQPLRNPQVSTSTVLSAVEHLAAGESYARQASVKWRAPFPRDWGGTSTEGKPISVVYRCDNAGLQTCPTEALDQSGFRGGFDLTSLALRGEDLCSKTSIRYLECCSGGGWRTRERTGACGCSKTCCHQKAADPEELASGALCRSELSLSDHALSLLSFDSLEVSLKTLCADSPANLGSPVCVSLSVHSPACRFRNGNQDSDLCEAGGELGEDSGGPTLSAREHAADLPHWKLGRFGEHWQAANSIGATVVGSSGNGSPNSMPGDCWPDAENSQGGGPSAEQTGKRTTALYDEESNNRMDDKQKEDLESMEKKRNRPLPQRVDPQLEKCFVAWRNHVSGKTATAQALYERQLLRKGLAALRWAVQLRKVQAGIAQRNHILVVLAASFRKWQDALAKQRKAPPSPQQEAANPIRGAPTTPEAGGVRMSPNLCHLPAEHLEDAARYSRAEGNLWTQLHCQQGGGETCRKAAALRDVRRLAAAFRLWRLQKERLEKEEIRAQEALALLEKKRLVSAFEAWRSRYRAARRILPLVAQVQKGLLSRHFSSESQDLAAADLLMQAPFPLGYGHTQNRRQLLAKCFAFWSARTVQNLKAEQHRKRALLSRAFTSWSAAAACFSTWRTTLACLERARRQRLLASSFGKWKAEFLRAERRRKDERPRRRLAGYGATWRWRKAIRGSWALRFSSISQASGYWTRAATFRQCVRRQSGFIGSRKFLKAPLLWPSRRRRTSDEAPRPGLAIRSRLTCSSFRVWLTLYRCQSKTLGPQRAPMHLEAVGQGSRHGWSQETRPEMTLFAVGRRWLGRKYLTRWKHRVLLRRFQHRKEKRCLAGAWVVWKDSCQTELAVQALVRQRLAQWSWAVWRRRCLQSWVAERFLAGEERQLLEQAFGRWRQLTASRSEGRGDF
ncbi:uncharacterized protein C1orf167 homolog isoform X7 [Podarcis raffonei]|uniref:uncharacterized protein C1orf167 homolog isoform X7 n=1 Tax=Podarcis raffonei TaxID=65483 RepID=UPI0023291745|nr:uncharacterized protein C1orf167 homolog isoform X7 [Podarcis raffonei]